MCCEKNVSACCKVFGYLWKSLLLFRKLFNRRGQLNTLVKLAASRLELVMVNE